MQGSTTDRESVAQENCVAVVVIVVVSVFSVCFLHLTVVSMRRKRICGDAAAIDYIYKCMPPKLTR